MEQQEIFSADFTQLVRDTAESEIYVAVTSGEQKFFMFVCLFFSQNRGADRFLGGRFHVP